MCLRLAAKGLKNHSRIEIHRCFYMLDSSSGGFVHSGFKSAFGGVYGKCGTKPQGFGSLHALPPGGIRRCHRQSM